MLLEYMQQKGMKPTQSEYNKLYKEIAHMLVEAPKNAVAIQARTAKTADNQARFIELFYHVTINNKIDYAQFKYIEIRTLVSNKSQKVHESQENKSNRQAPQK